MASPSVRVRVDKQGRLVLPQQLREGFVTAPGELVASLTPDGLLLQPTTGHGTVAVGDDGLPLLQLDRPVTNAEVLAAVDAERAER